ncbi:hypothetical protein [Sphingomonas sp. PB1R3]|uniref:hypothetical protein n=1 Tax=Sphingomonas flavida TaxID=3096154 RepID=UPI002FC6C10C
MTSYGFGKKPTAATGNDKSADRIDLAGINRQPVAVDPRREEDAIKRGAAMGFVDRAERSEADPITETRTVIRRQRRMSAKRDLYIKGPAETLDWFIQYTNDRGHRAYWEALEELRALVEKG